MNQLFLEYQQQEFFLVINLKFRSWEFQNLRILKKMLLYIKVFCKIDYNIQIYILLFNYVIPIYNKRISFQNIIVVKKNNQLFSTVEQGGQKTQIIQSEQSNKKKRSLQGQQNDYLPGDLINPKIVLKRKSSFGINVEEGNVQPVYNTKKIKKMK